LLYRGCTVVLVMVLLFVISYSKWTEWSTIQRVINHATTLMIQFSARGTYFLLVPQGRALVRDRARISFLRNNRMFKTKR